MEFKLQRGDIEFTCGKPIDSSVLKRNHDKRKACDDIRMLCEEFSRGNTSCPACEEERKSDLTEIYGFNYVECLGCSLVYISNPPSASEIECLYNSIFYNEMENSLYGDPEISQYRVNNIAVPKVEYVEECIGKKGAWLDIGCGTGEIIAAAHRRGWRVHGIETNERAAEMGRNRFGVPISTEFVTEHEVRSLVGNFDVVSMFGVLEHIKQPRPVIEAISTHLDPNAVLVIEVPHYPSVSALSQITFPQLVDRILAPPMHLMIFSLHALAKLLHQYGLTVKHVWFYGQDFYELVTTLMEVCQTENNKGLFDLLLKLTSDFQDVIDRHKLSDEMLIIARKGVGASLLSTGRTAVQ